MKVPERMRLPMTLLVSTGLFVVYLCLAALVLQAEEAPAFRQQVAKLEALEQQFLANHTGVDPEVFYQFLEDYTQLLESIPGSDRRQYQSRQAWNFVEAFFYVTSVVTTIGYGNLTPITVPGQMWTVVFALLGVPLFIFIIHAYTGPLERQSLRLYRAVKRRACPARGGSEDDPRVLLVENCVVLLCLLVAILCVFLLLPSLVFARVEGWSYEQALYYAFISVATIGFGDFEAGIDVTRDYSPVYIGFIFVWLVVSIVSLGLALSVYRNIMNLWGQRSAKDLEEPLIPMDSLPNGNSGSIH